MSGRVALRCATATPVQLSSSMPESPPARRRGRPGRPRQREGEAATEERLLQAAAVVFSQSEYEGARLEDVAERAGITRPSLLHHFRSKRELYQATLAYSFRHLSTALEAAMVEEGDYEARVVHLARTLTEFDDNHRAMLSTIFRGILRDDDIARDELRTHVFPLLEALEAFIRQSAGDNMPPEFPIRAYLLAFFANEMLHSALGDFGAELWQGGSQTVELGAAIARLWMASDK